MEELKVIRQYTGKRGAILVEEYKVKREIKYHVKYKDFPVFNSWHDDKAEAIKQAQFIAGKY